MTGNYLTYQIFSVFGIPIEFGQYPNLEVHIKNSFFSNQKNAICYDKALAEQLIKMHKEEQENNLKEQQLEEHKKEMDKIKKTIYIKVKQKDKRITKYDKRQKNN